MEELKRALEARGLIHSPLFDNQFHRFEADGGMHGWCISWAVRDDYDQIVHLEARFGGLSVSMEAWKTEPPEGAVVPGAIADKIAEARAVALKRIGDELAADSGLIACAPEARAFSLDDVEIEPIAWRQPPGKTAPQPPSQNQVAEALADFYGKYLMREREDVFLWTGTHWQEQDSKNFKRFIRVKAQFLMSGAAKDKELDAHYNLLLDKLYCMPSGMSFYQQNPFLANFLDGTLEIQRVGNKYSLEFREHRREDFLSWVLPYGYRAPRPQNPVFREWLQKTFNGDPDAEGKLRALKQIGGACLLSLFPRTAFLYGPGGTGKSTFAKLCAAFVGGDNMTGVQPSMIQQGSFMMESLIGKQVNIVTDISEARIDSAIFKQIEDRVKFQINRKNKLAIMAYIPALHIFCGNVLPRGIDGVSSAMDRRISIVEFVQDVGPGTGAQIRDYEQVILGAGTGDVLQFFLDGLQDLCDSGGLYFNPESGKKKLSEWKLENDPFGRFIEAIRAGDFTDIKLHCDASIRAGVLWEGFEQFKNTRRIFHPMGRNSFYALLKEQGFPCKDDRNGILHFYGIGALPGLSAGVSWNNS